MTDVAFIFVDIETTGLDVNKDVPLELGIKLVNRDLQVLDSWSRVIWCNDWRAKLARNDFVWEMHVKSGLVSALSTLPSRGPVFESHPDTVSKLALEWLVETWDLKEKQYPMVGSSIQFDRMFAARHLPVFHDFFSYRNIDISSLKELCKVLNPELADKMSNAFKKENAAHRVLPDIEASIGELQAYVDNFLFVP